MKIQMAQTTKLYQPEKYKVYLGKGRGIGFCTVWNEPKTIFNKSKIIRDNSVMLGTLYSRQGVSIILRNLALNPQIRTVYLWGNGDEAKIAFQPRPPCCFLGFTNDNPHFCAWGLNY